MKGLKPYILTLLPFILIGATFVSSCIKRKNNVIAITPALLERFSYKPGSYWIMRDSITGRIDSFYITSSVSNNISLRAGLEVQNVVAQMQQLSADKADTSRWEFRYVKNQLSLNVLSKTYPGVYYPCGYMLYPLTISHPTFQLNAYYYADVNESNIVDDSTRKYNNSLFLNEANGLIKMRLNHPSDSQKHFVWELLRKNIVL